MIVSKNGNYAVLENVRVSYDPAKDTIHLTSKDPDLPEDRGGFRLTLNGASKEEQMLREMLVIEGVIKPVNQLPSVIYAPASEEWDCFPVGVSRNRRGEEIKEFWKPYVDSHLALLGFPGSGKSNMAKNLISHASQFPDKWRVHSIDFSQAEDSNEYLKQTIDLLWKLKDEVKSRLGELNRKEVSNYKKMPNGQSVLVIIDSFVSPNGGLKLANPSESPLVEVELNELRQIGVQLLQHLTTVGKAVGIFIVLGSYSSSAVPLGLLCRFPSQIATRMTAKESVYVTGQQIAAKLPSSPGRAWYHRSNTGRIIQGYLAG